MDIEIRTYQKSTVVEHYYDEKNPNLRRTRKLAEFYGDNCKNEAHEYSVIRQKKSLRN